MLSPKRVPKSDSSGVADVDVDELTISSSCSVFIISMACSDTFIGFFSRDSGVVDDDAVGAAVDVVTLVCERARAELSNRVAIVGIVGV